VGKVLAVCISGEKGTAKRNVGKAEFTAGHGLTGDAHAGPLIRELAVNSGYEAAGYTLLYPESRANRLFASGQE
jgi:hypothetical protein